MAARAASIGLLDIPRRVRARDEPGLELRRRQIDAALEHRPEEHAEAAVSDVTALLKSRTRSPVKNGVSIEPSALTCSGTPASRAASARPAARA